jgi:hypothetical protein
MVSFMERFNNKGEVLLRVIRRDRESNRRRGEETKKVRVQVCPAWTRS